MRTNSPLATALSSRGAIIELTLAAVVLALGVNFLASAASFYYIDHEWTLALFGASLALLSISIITRQTIAAGKTEQLLHGFVCFQRETPELIDVPRYKYINEIKRFIEALFAENEAPKKLWEADPVHKTIETDLAKGTAQIRTTAAGQLLIEATEYFLLEKLSTHLTDYFNHSNVDSSRLHEIRREYIGAVVFSNRFLDTFSRPMRERPAFVDQTMSDDSLHESVVASSVNGLRFSRLDLVLPSGAKLIRNSSNSISIDTPRFKLTLSVHFAGFNTSLPHNFEKLYLGSLKPHKVSTFKISIASTIEFKPFALLTRKGWIYHQWIDSFLTNLERDFSRNSFFDRIQWECALTTARVVECAMAAKSAKQSHSESGAA